MKVDYTRPAYGTSGTYGADLAARKSGTQVSTGTPASDSLSISGDVGLATRAMAAASAAPDIRPDAVARGQALLEKGVDTAALSDAMISGLLESWRQG